MTINPFSGRPNDPAGDVGGNVESSTSAICWPAILGGAAVALSIAVVLALLGAGFGLSSVSPWSNTGISTTTLTVTAAIWLVVVQWIASGMGGYITGRLRTKWASVHSHEVFFRDTAHGLMTWAVAALIGIVVMTSAVSAVVSGGAQAVSGVVAGGAQAIGGAAQAGASNPAAQYYVDRLFRSDKPDAGTMQFSAEQASRIMATVATTGNLTPEDRTYLAQMISARTGVAQPDAEKRVDDAVSSVKAVETKVKQVADTARAAAAKLAIYSALSLLIGAFIASAAAALGGKLRDESEVHAARET